MRAGNEFVGIIHSKLALSRPGGEIGRHNGLKIRRLETAVPVQVRPRAPTIN